MRFLKLDSLSAGNHTWSSWANDTTGNANGTPNYTLNITRAPVNVTMLVNNSGTNRTFNGLVFNFTATKNVSQGTIELVYNNTDVNLQLNSSTLNTAYRLWLQNNATGYLLTARYNETQNYSAAAYAIQVTLSPGAATYSGANASCPTVYSTSTPVWFNATWSHGLTLNVTFDVDGLNRSPLQIGDTYFLKYDNLSAGTHYFISYANDTAANMNATTNRSCNISKGAVNASAYLNASEENRTITGLPNVTNFTATKNVSEGTIELRFNHTVSNQLVNSSTGQVAYYIWLQNNETVIRLTARYAQTQNYSASNESILITFANDTQAPRHSNNQTNSTYYGEAIMLGINWTDNLALANYTFSWNAGNGTWVNDTVTPMTGGANWSNITKNVPSTSTNFSWKWYAWDNASNMNATPEYSFNTSSPGPTPRPPITGSPPTGGIWYGGGSGSSSSATPTPTPTLILATPTPAPATETTPTLTVETTPAPRSENTIEIAIPPFSSNPTAQVPEENQHLTPIISITLQTPPILSYPITFTLKELETPPAPVRTALGVPLSMISITTNAPPGLTNNTRITFKLPIAAVNLTTDSVTLARLDGLEWVELPTQLLSKDGNYYIFETTTSEITTFTILRKPIVTQAATTDPTPSPTNTAPGLQAWGKQSALNEIFELSYTALKRASQLASVVFR